MAKYQVCTRCVMDSSDPGVTFDDQGVCSVCKRYEEARIKRGYVKGKSERELEETVALMKRKGRKRPYDCIIGISGGVDSAYLLYMAQKLGLRTLAVHVDGGWNSEIAEKNIRRMCEKLQVQLHTWTVDWPTMKELQRAYMYSGVANLDIPQDHLFCSAMLEMARKYKVRYVLNGSNIATEGASSPFTPQHSYRDKWHMRSIYRTHGRGKSLKKYPFLSLHTAWFGMHGIRQVHLLNMIPYSKADAIDLLQREFGWEYYGGKHFESRFTRYFQSVYLPRKFGYDKRRYHLSCLVLNGEMTRTEALEELSQPCYPPAEQEADEKYILDKLDIPQKEWHRILNEPPIPDDSYFSQRKLIEGATTLIGKRRMDLMRQRLYRTK